jgi:hypothetical protein
MATTRSSKHCLRGLGVVPFRLDVAIVATCLRYDVREPAPCNVVSGTLQHVMIAVGLACLPLRIRPDQRPILDGSSMVEVVLLTQGPRAMVHVLPGR